MSGCEIHISSVIKYMNVVADSRMVFISITSLHVMKDSIIKNR
jgi:hypothetical protein